MADDAVNHRQVLTRITFEATRKLFDELGVSVRERAGLQGTGATPMVYGGVIELNGKGVRGRMTLASSGEPLAATKPVANGGDRDWLAELTNQLMGRIKNQLLLYAVEVTFGSPVTLRAEHLEARDRGKDPPLVFEGGGGFVQVWLDVQLDRTFQMRDRPDPKLGGPEQGRIVLF
jgi:hypothetical protein